MIKLVLKVKGMHCASCAILIDKLLAKQEGVIKSNTSYGAQKVGLEFDEAKISLEEIDAFVNQLGYDVIRPDEETGSLEEDEKAEERELELAKRRVIAAFTLSSPIIAYYMAVHMFNLTHVHQIWGIDLNYIYWVLSTPIQFVIGWPFYRNAWAAVRIGAANMDVLVVLGTTAAYVYSMFGFLFFNIDHPFWESSAALISFILLGRYVEVVAKGRASSAIKELLKLEAKEAHVIRDGKEVTIPLEDLAEGDVLVVKPGEKIPVDGLVVEGETHIDEKVVTGESFPVKRVVGDEVIGATVNLEGRIKFKATKVGKETLLNQIIKMVEEAQASRAPVQDLVDKVSEYFVPAVVILSVLTFVGWYFIADLPLEAGVIRMIAVLVISCPCAMGLATPTALVVGIGQAAKYGIILKGGEALEKAYRITTITLDKTGTLTIGKPIVTDFLMISDKITEKDAAILAASAEMGSEHPLARAVIEYGKQFGEPIDPKKFEAVQGMGLKASIPYKGKATEVMIGNLKLMDTHGKDVKKHKKELERLQSEAKTTVFLLVNGEPIAMIGMADALKPFAMEAIDAMKKMGKEVVMITGDNQKTADAIARQIGITRVLAEVLPQDKAATVKKLQEKGENVAMVGDGINDSPALAQANLGIAIGSGTDVAIETGEVVLVKDDLRDVVTAIQLSSKTMKKIWQNLFWAFIYNIGAIPVAAGGHLLITQQGLGGAAAGWVVMIQQQFGTAGQIFFNISQATLRPEIAGFAMAFSSVSVVVNSMTLRLYNPPMEKLSTKQDKEHKLTEDKAQKEKEK